jgi:hypothetical protein
MATPSYIIGFSARVIVARALKIPGAERRSPHVER